MMKLDYFYLIMLFVPAMVANVTPPILAKILPKFWNFPIDGYASINHKRILGDNKTWKGLVGGVVLGQFSFLLIKRYLKSLPFYFGFFSGLGVLGGDCLESFIKRRMNVNPGKLWFPFDQIDWIIGFLVILSFFIKVDLPMIIFYLVFGFTLHILGKIIGYWLKINNDYI